MVNTEVKSKHADLIKTIEEDAEVQNFSEDSDAEIEYQPTKLKRKKKDEFNDKFEFASSVAEYNHDTWDDLMKYVKRKARTKTDDKIAEAIKNRIGNDDDDDDEDGKDSDEFSLSDDELIHDGLNVRAKREKKKKKKLKTVEQSDENDIDKDFFDEIPDHQEISSFYQMNLSRPLMRAIGVKGYVYPTPIQLTTIPIALEGRDICGCAATGTGKTAAYMLPTLERLLYRPLNNKAVIRVLVLAPTRELAAQIYRETKELTQFTTIETGLAIGGLELATQEAILRQNPDVVVATPGRLIDHMQNTPNFNLESVEVLIIDEADRMLDENFAEQMKEIIKMCSRSRQTMLFSATMTDSVKDLVAVSLNKPIRLFVNTNQTVAFNLRQEFIRIREEKEIDREPILTALICRTFRDHCMVFVQTKRQAHRLHILLGLLGIKAGELHGNLTQPQRLESLKLFKEEQIDILIATDVAARGLDIVGVKTVINFNMPITTEHYIHRVGRTARAGRAGISVSLAGEKERNIVKDILKNAQNTVKNRIIPPEIIEKYRKKLSSLEPEIQSILDEEYSERMFAKMEQELNKTENSLKGLTNQQRMWFQTMKQRKEERERLAIKPPSTATTSDGKSVGNNKRKRQSDNKDNKTSKKSKKEEKKTPGEIAKERIKKDMEKMLLVRAKYRKAQNKPQRLNAMPSDQRKSTNGFTKRDGKKKYNSSKFSHDLTDISQKGAKRLRYDATHAKKMKKIQSRKKTSKVKLTNKSGKNKFNSGKNFGGPRFTKKKRNK